MANETEILKEIKKFNQEWKKMRYALNIISVFLGITAIVTSVIVSVYTGTSPELLSAKSLKVIAVVSTSALTLLTAFNIVGLSNNTIRAWRHLNVAILKYEAGINKINDLIEAYKEGEQLIGHFNFNYASANPANDAESKKGGDELNNDNKEIFSKEAIENVVKEVKSKKDANVLGVGYLPKNEDGKTTFYLHMNVKDEETKKKYQDTLKCKNSKNQDVTPPMEIVVTNKAHTQSNKLPGTGIRNVVGTNGEGTFGCVVIDNSTNQKCILSCQHVLKNNADYNTIDGNTTIILSDGSNNNFATHKSGIRNNEIDAGLALLKDQTIDNRNLGILKIERDITDTDVTTNKRVMIKGYDLDEKMVIPQFGVIINNGFEIFLDYQDNEDAFPIQDTIVLSRGTNDFKAISKPGYSGSLVLDEDRFVIGMVVGGDDKFTYAIPINKIKSKLKFSILNQKQ
jgi:hypothetical protein